MKKNKNVSKKIPNGRTFQTRDEFLESGKGKKNIKPDHPSKSDLYRRVAVIDSNRFDELIVVKLGTKGRHEISTYGNGKSKYDAFVEIYDNKNRPLKRNYKTLRENSPRRDLTAREVTEIKKNVYSNEQTSKRLRRKNRAATRKVKHRK